MAYLLNAITVLLALSIKLTFAAHAGFHVQYPWASRGANPRTRPEIDRYNPFCGEIVHNPGKYPRRSRTDLVTALYTRHRVPRNAEDFPLSILENVAIQPSGQLCLNVTIPFQTEENEIGVMYFEARDPSTGNVEHHCVDVKMTDMEALPEEHPAMCAVNNETLIPMPDEYL